MEKTTVPHVLFLPFPSQGHVKPMLSLAELLNRAGFQTTFINTDHNYDLLLRNTDISSFNNRFPNFQFISFPDGLPPDHPRSGPLYIRDLFRSSRVAFKPALRELLISLKEEKGPCQLPTCIIADGILCFAIDVAEEFEIPTFTFRTYSAHCLWTYFHLSKLIEEGEIPFQDENLDKPISCIPGLENVLRPRDLPGISRFEKADDPILQFFVKETFALTRASGLILNTINEIEAPMITRLGSFFNKIYTIGPLHTLKSCINDPSPSNSSNGILWKEDKKCLRWLDSQPSKSVLYVSFGSVINLTRDQILEFCHGLINSGKSFLWVIRPDLIVGDATIGDTLMELENGVMERGLIVSWAPQEEVLSHPAIGGFLTHSGWNSTLESITTGVPMICWPQMADQQVNSRCVSDVWKIGFDMKGTCDRSIVENSVRELMDGKRDDIMASSDRLARMARDSIQEGGSSCINLEKLIQDIKSMSS